MRGRTNASNGGIFLNATTDNFEVATGNTIVAGDFVEYMKSTGEREVYGSNYGKECFLVDSQTNLYITRISGYVALITYVDGVITEKYIYNVSTSTELVKYDNTTYISLSGDVYIVDVANQTVSLSFNIGISFNSKSGNYLIKVQSTYSSSYTYVITTYDCSDLENVTQIDQDNSMHEQSGATFIAGVGFNGGHCFAVTFTYSSSPYTAYGQLYYVYIDETTGEITSINKETVYNLRDNTKRVSGSISFTSKPIGGRYLLIHISQNDGYASGTVYLDRIYDTVTRTIKLSNLSGSNNVIPYLSPYYESNGYWYWMLTRDESSVDKTYLYKTDMLTGITDLLDTEEISTNLKNVAWLMKNNDFARLRTNSTTLLYNVVKVIAEKISGEIIPDTVEEWSGGTNPMGVAKQNGNAGDTIEVYIPQVNS